MYFYLVTPLVHCGLHRSLTCSVHIHPSTYTPPPTPASHTGASSMVVFHRCACDSTTPSHQLNQPQHAPLPLNRDPETHEQVPSSIQDAVSYRIRPIFASPLLSSLNSADLPFLRMICKAVLTIWSQSSEYEFNVILVPQWTSSSFSRRRCERRNRILRITRNVGRVHLDPGFRERQHRGEIG